MANDTVVRIGADANGYMAELAKAKTSAQAFAVSQDALAARVTTAQQAIKEATANSSTASTRSVNSFIQSLAKQAEQAGKTRSEMLQMQASMLGVSAAATPYINQIKAAEQAMAGLGHSSTGTRRELLVMAHELSQGNFSRLGGSMMVLAERMDLTKYITPTNIALAALAVVAVGVYTALNSVQAEVDKFNASLKLTNDWAGVTRESAAQLAQTIATQTGTSFGTAQSNIDATVASGRVLGQDLQTVTIIAMDMAKQTEEGFDKALEKVIAQSDNVQKAAEDWQKSHHDMSQATLDHIKAVDEAGDHVTALRILYDQELQTMQSGTSTQVGLMSRMWHGFLDDVGRIGRAMTGNSTSTDQLAALKSQLADTRADGPNPLGINSKAIQDQIAALEKQMQAQQAATDQQNRAKSAAASLDQMQQTVNKALEQGASNAEKRTKAEKSLNDQYTQRIALAKQAGTYTPQLDAQFASQRDRLIADADNRYKDPKTPKAPAYHDDAATAKMQQLSDQHATLQAQLDTDQKLSGAEQELVKFNQQISDWKGKTLTDAQKSLVAHQDELRVMLQQNVQLEKQIQQREEIQKLHERSGQIGSAIDAYQTNQRGQYSRQLDAYGMGTEAQQRAQAVKGIYGEYNRQAEELTKSTPADLLGSKDYQDDLAKIQAGLQQSLQLYDQYYTDLKEKQADWTNGVATAMQDYVDMSANSARSAQQAFEGATKSIEDAVTKFVTTGKINLQSLSQTIETDITRKIVQNGISGLFSNGSSMLGALSGFFSKNTGAAANVASALPGDSLGNLMNLTKGFGTMGGPMNVAELQSAIQSTSTLTAATATVASMTVGTMVGSGGSGSGGAGDALGGLLGSLGGGDMAGMFGFTATGVAGSADAVASGAGIGDGMSTLFGLGGSSAFSDAAMAAASAVAGGGDVSGGSPYYVGEQGPELFVPGVSGSIVPHYALTNAPDRTPATSSSGSAGSTFNMNISVPPGSTQQTANQQAMSIMRQARIAMARNG
ncbi:phage tail tape measure protein [Paraburkholderia tuberum]|uniref:Phage tail tape measure protein, lambda family n=1 Tax=Paraburkholderia tuberum TaxID=157910 RepID=A0A1H1JAP4_9BURK|nr:phage tail tape measure protein [Paraburkholderia tuberum]SDR47065.1 phage tail tape measure protein, lambda family [Paraburkholderia tuberum]